MPVKTDKKRGYIGYRAPPDIENRINKLLDSEIYDTKADIISIALRFWFDNKDKKSQKELFKEWVLSPEGKAEVKQLIREIINAEK